VSVHEVAGLVLADRTHDDDLRAELGEVDGGARGRARDGQADLVDQVDVLTIGDALHVTSEDVEDVDAEADDVTHGSSSSREPGSGPRLCCRGPVTVSCRAPVLEPSPAWTHAFSHGPDRSVGVVLSFVPSASNSVTSSGSQLTMTRSSIRNLPSAADLGLHRDAVDVQRQELLPARHDRGMRDPRIGRRRASRPWRRSRAPGGRRR
jgi:hypothetical protein